MKSIRILTTMILASMLMLSLATPVFAEVDVCESADVVIVIDRSGSMSGAPLAAAKTAAKYFVDLLNMASDGDHSAEASFASSASLEQGLTDDATAVKNAIDSLSAGGGTCIGCGIDVAQAELDANGRVDTNKVIVLLSDGVPGDNPVPSADAAKAKGTIIFTIGIGGADQALMESLASKPSYFSFGTQDELDAFYEQIAQEVCQLPPGGDNDVPEFGALAALGILGIAGLVIMRKRK